MNCCLSMAHPSDLLLVTGGWWWPAACHRCTLVACRLLTARAGSLLPVSAHAGGLPAVIVVCQLPATCCWTELAYCQRRVPEICCLLLVSTSTLQQHTGVGW